MGRRRRKKGKKKRKHRLGTDMTAMTSVFPFAAPPRGKSKNVTMEKLKGNLYSLCIYKYIYGFIFNFFFLLERKGAFMKACVKEFQEVCEGMYILPGFTPTSGKIKVFLCCF